ncbi:hypothetical protein ANO14919_076400 [Xylariales sp. No.14919]|nr:hypothetical protein ANO14919_076400 [Xylariales sp. No.14919]
MAVINLGIEVKTASATPTSDQETAPAHRTIRHEETEIEVITPGEIMVEYVEIRIEMVPTVLGQVITRKAHGPSKSPQMFLNKDLQSRLQTLLPRLTRVLPPEA